MSLYVGRLSPHIRPEQLIQNFRKFGNCDLRLKNGYGFVIYEFNEDAERALRALRGKTICGEQISLYWSNRQPRPFQRSARPKRIYEPYHRGNIKEEKNKLHIGDFQDNRGFSRSAPHIPSYNGGRRRDDSHDKEGYACEVIKRKRDMTLTEGVIDEGNASESNLVESDCWGEPFNDALTADGVDNGSEFDRYEPYRGYDSRDEKENNQMANSYSSPECEGSQGKGLLEQSNDEPDKNFDKLKAKPKCYNCGQIGHIKHKCPEGDARRENFSKFSLWREEINFRDRGDEKRKVIRTNSWGRQDTIRGPLVVRYHERDMKESHSGNVRRLVKRSGCYTERRKNTQPKLQAKIHAKKQSKQEHGTRKKLLKKRRARRLDTSSLSSGSSSTNSSSHSQSSRSKPCATSRLTSRSSSRSLSPSSSSRSVSVSSYSKSKSSASKARSKSGSHMSPSLSVSVDKSGSHISPSLSVSLDKKPPSSPHNVLLNVSPSTLPKGKLQHPASPISKQLLLDSSEPKDNLAALNVDNEINGQYFGHNADDARASSSMVGLKENCSFINLPKSVGISEGSNEQGALVRKPKMRISGCKGRHPMKITTHEMILASKHYGLPAPEQIESGASVEEYFGAARLWPWEMIYYRRLKKGPISTENYARRLEQNKEFGIIDKYIRSSSGWSECKPKI